MNLRKALATAAALTALGAAFAGAQATSGRISGTVADAQGGVLPGATVTAVETSTRYTRTATTGHDGSFIFVSLPLGTYTVSAELQGFKRAAKSGFALVADGRVTADFALEVGGLTETVEVTIVGETVNTVSGEIARTVDGDQVQNLALNGRNYLQLATLIPGAPLLNPDALDIMTGLGINTSVNGSRTNSTLLTVDGGFNMDAGSNNSQISNVGIDFIAEVSIKTANFSAEYGRNSGAAINVVTRSGGNAFKGSVFGYLRDESLDANNYFSNARNVPRAELKYKDYGGTVGGPVIKDKLFFQVGLEWKTIRRFTAPTLRTLPTRAMRQGDFSAITTVVRDPLTGQQFPGNKIPANRITVDGKAIANLYDAMEKQASSYTDTPTQNNALYQLENPFDWRQEMARFDWNVNQFHRVTGRLVLDHYDLIEPGGTFINSQLPTVPTNRKRPGRNIQLNYHWTMKSNLVNELKLNYSGNDQMIPPVGDAWKRSTYGFQFPQLYPSGGAYEDAIPNASISGFASWRSANQWLMSPTWDYALADNLTWIKGAHTIKSGILLIYNTKDQNGRSDYTGSLNFSTSGNTRTTGYAFADALLGNFRSYNEAQIDPVGYFRFWQTEAFVSDAWRIGRDLSVEAGVRWAYHHPTGTLGNNTASFDPGKYDPAKAVTMKTDGTIVPGTGNRFNGLTRPGDVPADQQADVPNAGSPAVLALPFSDNPGYYKSQHLFAPRFSFAWVPGGSSRTAIRGGIGLFYDRPEGNLYFSLANNPPFNLSSEFQNGNLSNPGGGTAAPLAPWSSIDSLNPDLKIPRNWNWSVSVQRELGLWGLFGEVAYVGGDGQQLLRQPDINQVPFAENEKNQAGPRYNTNYLRPYKGFTSILMRLSDADSSYHSLQLLLTKRRGDLRFTLNYTLGRNYDNASGNGDNLEGYEDEEFNWGPSNQDRTHIFVATWSYRLPIFKRDKGVLGQVLGGWEVSGITRYQTGAPLTVTGNTSIGTRRADYLGGDPYIAEDQRINPTTGVVQWLNPAAFASAPEGRRGNSGRNAYRLPNYSVWDISLRKQFKLPRSMQLQVQADMFNAFNSVTWRGLASTSVTGSGFGTVNSANPSRNVQLAVRLTF